MTFFLHFEQKTSVYLPLCFWSSSCISSVSIRNLSFVLSALLSHLNLHNRIHESVFIFSFYLFPSLSQWPVLRFKEILFTNKHLFAIVFIVIVLYCTWISPICFSLLYICVYTYFFHWHLRLCTAFIWLYSVETKSKMCAITISRNVEKKQLIFRPFLCVLRFFFSLTTFFFVRKFSVCNIKPLKLPLNDEYTIKK